MNKAIAEHLYYREKLVRLKLWFLWGWLKDHPREIFINAFRERVDIYRLTEISVDTLALGKQPFSESAWLEVEERLESLYRNCIDDNNPARFEREGYRIIKTTIEACARRDYGDTSYLPGYQCGSLKYNPPREGNLKTVNIHIANAITPKSIFSDKKYISKCFFDLMHKSGIEYGADSFEIKTWLNSYPIWLELFPGEWITNMGPELKDVQGDKTFWGQFTNARGTFNERHGKQMRESGRFPYYPRHSWCAFKAFKRHLLNKYL